MTTRIITSQVSSPTRVRMPRVWPALAEALSILRGRVAAKRIGFSVRLQASGELWKCRAFCTQRKSPFTSIGSLRTRN